MTIPFLTAIFFPDYGYEGIPWDLYLLHFFFFAIVIPFHVIIFAARNAQTVKPNGFMDRRCTQQGITPLSLVHSTIHQHQIQSLIRVAMDSSIIVANIKSKPTIMV